MRKAASAWSASIMRITFSPQQGHLASRGCDTIININLRTIRPYDYQDAATLLADFWAEVDAVLKQRGVIP